MVQQQQRWWVLTLVEVLIYRYRYGTETPWMEGVTVTGSTTLELP